jgi:transposase
VLNPKKEHHITVIGAISSEREQWLAYKIYDTTTKENVQKFMRFLLGSVMPGRRTLVVLDLHPAHWHLFKNDNSIRQILEEKNVNLLYLPPSSSAMNPIEHVWAIFKREWSKVLFTGNGTISYNWAKGIKIATTLD